MAADLACDKFWVHKNMYHDAEKRYYENLAKLRKSGQNDTQVFGEEFNNKKSKENKRLQGKNPRSGCSRLDVDALRKELVSLEARNAKNESLKRAEGERKVCPIEIIQRKSEAFYENHDGGTDSEKRIKQKEGKERKSKNEKKAKRGKEKEERVMGGVGMANVNQDSFPKTSLAGEVAKARQHIKSSLQCMDQNINDVGNMTISRLTTLLDKMEATLENLTKRVEILEKNSGNCAQLAVCPAKQTAVPAATPTKPAKDDEDDTDLFASDSEEEDESAKRVREQRLAEYAAKKSKKPALIAKSNIILDIKPWDDETDMKEMEKAVRAIEMDGLIWGASKLVPVAFKIFKLQISCVVEDDKVSVDYLTETLEGIEDYIQSVDIAAFNKV